MDPERDEPESPSAGTGFETPGRQQCHPIWETGRTTADGFLTAGVGLNLGKHTSPTTERVDTRAVRTITTSADVSSPTEQVGLRAETAATPAKLRDKTTSYENKQFDPGGKGEKAPLWKAAVMVVFSFPGGGRWVWGAHCLCFVFFSVCSVLYVFILTIR